MHSASDPAAASAWREVGSGSDLTQEVTVFVTTVGAPSLPDCLAHLEAQDVRVRFELIDHVAPLPVALQRMLDRCETPYYVQVDEDMLLDSDAVRRLHELMSAEWPNVAVLVGLLYDPHLGRTIEGIKLHRLDFGREFPWTDYPYVFARNQALEAAGHRVARRPDVDSGPGKRTFGVHDIGRDPRGVFERYHDLERARLARPEAIAWFSGYPAQFLRRFLDKGDEVDFFALMGVLAAHRVDNAQPYVEPKDFRRAPPDALHSALEMWAAMRGQPPVDRATEGR